MGRKLLEGYAADVAAVDVLADGVVERHGAIEHLDGKEGRCECLCQGADLKARGRGEWIDARSEPDRRSATGDHGRGNAISCLSDVVEKQVVAHSPDGTEVARASPPPTIGIAPGSVTRSSPDPTSNRSTR